MAKKNIYPVLPLRDIVVYPKMIVPLFVGREKSIRALQEVVDQDQNIILLTQKEAAIEDPTENDVYHVGTVGTVLQMLKPNTQIVYLCLDNDKAGQAASERIAEQLREHSVMTEQLVPELKDWNEDLLHTQKEELTPCLSL